jgi:hypothetical protein
MVFGIVRCKKHLGLDRKLNWCYFFLVHRLKAGEIVGGVMIDLTEFFTRAQVGFAMMVIAFVIFWRFFVVIPPRRASRKGK